MIPPIDAGDSTGESGPTSGAAARRARLQAKQKGEREAVKPGASSTAAKSATGTGGETGTTGKTGTTTKTGKTTKAGTTGKTITAHDDAEAGAEANAATGPKAAKALDPDRLAALEEERDFLLGSLDDLEREHDVGDVDDGDYEALKDDYTARAAAVLRAIELRNDTMATLRRPRARGRSWGVAVVVVLAALIAGVAVAQASGRRAPGATTSGEIRKTTREQLFQAQQLFGEGKLLDAVKVYDEVLKQEPANVEALTYKGWLLRLTSTQTDKPEDRTILVARALELLDRAVATDPTYADARVFRAILLDSLGRYEQALADLQAIRPGTVPEFMKAMVDSLRSRVEAGVKGGPGSGPANGPASGPASTSVGSTTGTTP